MRTRPQDQHRSFPLNVPGAHEPRSRAGGPRAVIHHRSPTPATGNLHILLSELGDTAGPMGATRLNSDHVFAAA
ncbi:hypothetical protein [Actinomadura rudentiformis]|uniref:hypothetical protein n=1 Tax=Actinomadura rudentiformis TaxID=359158 RepID=UPI00178C49CB|nr:hypothetical protein [Actinomadura rudentiformis]